MKLHNRNVLSTALQAGSVNSCKRFLAFQPQKLLVLSFMLALPVIALGQQARSISFPTSIQWAKQNGVAKYRLQIASDENFRSIFFDGRVNGEQYTVSGLPPG